jgi:hypothetical protein
VSRTFYCHFFRLGVLARGLAMESLIYEQSSSEENVQEVLQKETELKINSPAFG